MKWLKKVAATPLTSIARVIDSLEEVANDRANAPSIHSVREAINDNWLTIYPIGSIYMSVNNVDPSTVFGGTWQQIKDRFLLACGDTYNTGETGGAANHTPSGSVGNHTLTVNEMPAHTHTIGGEVSTTTGAYCTFTYEDDSASDQGNMRVSRITGAGSRIPITDGGTNSVGGGQGHSHTFTGISENSGNCEMKPSITISFSSSE